ncbi:MAG: flagellar hook-length control protein FliK [Lachnospiraceae bacterium]|jgi:flagellar hook-length control protein FliK|nr:flagellar hook-length control protein FliK [Lachnospiraceae bacterium]
MTNMSIKDVKFLVNFIGQLETNGSTGSEKAGNNAAFGDYMKQATKSNQSASILLTHPPRQNESPPQVTAAESSSKASAPTSAPAKVEEQPRDVISDEKADKIREAVHRIANEIAEEAGIPPEDVLAILAAHDISLLSLLNTSELGEIIAVLHGVSAINLMTDEGMYATFTGLMEQIITTTEDLLTELDINPEELRNLLAQMQNEESNSADSRGALTDSVNLLNELDGEKMTKAEGEVKVTVEKNGVITEMTVKIDENGNMEATKEISTSEPTDTAAAYAQSNGMNQETGQKGMSESGQESLQGNPFSEKVDNTILQSEAAPAAETPDTAMIMRQIMDYMKIQLSPEVDQLEMQLHPKHLGMLGVKIASHGGVITAQFTTQNEVVKAAIESQLIDLRETLRSQGIRVDSVEVNVESQAFSQELWQGKDEAEREQAQDGKSRRRINLTGVGKDELPEDLSDEEMLQAAIMLENGQTVDFSA